MTRPTVRTLLAAALLVASCSGTTVVGSDDLLDVEETTAGRLGALDQPSEPATPPSAADPASEATLEEAAATPEPSTEEHTPEPQPVETTPTYPPTTVEITATGFTTPEVRVWLGTEVRFLNSDGVAHELRGSGFAWASGPIEPGAHASWIAERPGRFSFEDVDAIYYVATVEVLEP